MEYVPALHSSSKSALKHGFLKEEESGSDELTVRKDRLYGYGKG